MWLRGRRRREGNRARSRPRRYHFALDCIQRRSGPDSPRVLPCLSGVPEKREGRRKGKKGTLGGGKEINSRANQFVAPQVAALGRVNTTPPACGETCSARNIVATRRRTRREIAAAVSVASQPTISVSEFANSPHRRGAGLAPGLKLIASYPARRAIRCGLRKGRRAPLSAARARARARYCADRFRDWRR